MKIYPKQIKKRMKNDKFLNEYQRKIKTIKNDINDNYLGYNQEFLDDL